MRLAYLTGEYPRATDTFIQREVAELRRLGLHITTIAVRRPSSRHMVGLEQQEESQRTHYLLPASPWMLVKAHLRMLAASPWRYFSAARLAWQMRQPGFRGTMYQLFYFAEAALVCSIIKSEGVEHLHNHFANSSCSLSMLAAEMGGFPFSFTMHGPAIFFEPTRWRLDQKIRRAKFVACISHFCRSQGMAFSRPEHWSKMRIVHCGVEFAIYRKRRHKGRGARLVFVGRLAAVKGLPILLEALTKLGPDVALTIVGDGEDRRPLEQMAHNLGVAPRVKFLGYQSQSEVCDILADSDVFVMTSFAEGVPVVLMEAMASGLPVVATRIAGVPELVEDGVHGYLIPPGDIDALVDKLRLLIEDADLRRQMGEAGRLKVALEFDVHRESRWLKSIMTGEAGEMLRPALAVTTPEHSPANEQAAAGVALS